MKFRKITALLVSALLCASVLGGCNLFSGQPKTMGQVIEKAIELETYTATTEIVCYIDEVKYSVTLEETCDGQAIALDASVFASGISLGFDEIAIITEHTLYVNVNGILDGLKSVSSLLGVDLSGFECETQWVKLTTEESLLAKDTSLTKEILDACDEAYGELVTETDGTYTLDLSDTESQISFLETTRELLEEKETEWAEKFDELDDSAVLLGESLLEAYYDEILQMVLDSLNQYGLDLTEDDLESFFEEMAKDFEEEYEIDSEELGEAADYAQKMNELMEKLDELIENLKAGDGPDGSAVISVSKEDSVYTFTLDGSYTEEDVTDTFSMKTTLLECTPETIVLPEEASELMDYMPTFIGEVVKFSVTYLLGASMDLNEEGTSGMEEDTILTVGQDIEAGVYILVNNKTDGNGATYTIQVDGVEKEWDYFYYDDIVLLEDGEVFGYSDATLYERSGIKLETTGSGQFQVGYDLEPGTYTVKLSEGMSYVSYTIYNGLPLSDYSNQVEMDIEMVSEANPSPSFTVTLEDGQYIEIEGGYLE